MLKFIYILGSYPFLDYIIDYNSRILKNVLDGDSFSINIEIYKLANYFNALSL